MLPLGYGPSDRNAPPKPVFATIAIYLRPIKRKRERDPLLRRNVDIRCCTGSQSEAWHSHIQITYAWFFYLAAVKLICARIWCASCGGGLGRSGA